jgi:hypothetical protein
MAINWARGGLFVGGIVVGALVAGALFTQGGGERKETAAAPTVALQQTAAVSNGRRIDCSFSPIVAAASKEDGLLPLDKDLQGNSPSAVATLILSGKEAAAAGKPRDAETAFLMACRSAEEVKNDPIPLADAQYQLGRHYAQVASPPDAPRRQELLKRAEALYASSLQVYLKHRGPQHEKTRFAQEGLDALHQLTGAAAAPVVAAPGDEATRMAENTKVAGNAPQAAVPAPAPVIPPPVAPAPAVTPPQAVTPPPAAKPAQPAPVANAAPPKPATEVAKAAETAPAPEKAKAPAPGTAKTPDTQPAQETAKVPEPRTARRTSPSFDCANARSTTEKLICADEDLARQDRELGRLHARARQAAADPRAFQRESDAEWQEREQTCTDRECLQRWYAKRRAELSAAAERNERERTRRAERTERTQRRTEPAARPEPEPAPAPRVAVPAPPPVRVEPAPPPPPRVVEAPPVQARDPEPPPPPTESMGGPAPTATGSTDVPVD